MWCCRDIFIPPADPGHHHQEQFDPKLLFKLRRLRLQEVDTLEGRNSMFSAQNINCCCCWFLTLLGKLTFFNSHQKPK